ncbi:MAG TPA: twin-arginine translocase TatA/TatE family subunit [Chloroflexota bacterium]
MFFSHMPELLVVLFAAFLIFGPKKLPEIGSGLGQGIRGFKREISALTDETATEKVAVDREKSSVL